MKEKVEKKQYLFDNKALITLIIPLVVEQLLAVLVGMADSIMIANVGEAAVSGEKHRLKITKIKLVLFIILWCCLSMYLQRSQREEL